MAQSYASRGNVKSPGSSYKRAGWRARKASRSRDGGERSRKFSRILRVFSEYTAPRAVFTRQNGLPIAGMLHFAAGIASLLLAITRQNGQKLCWLRPFCALDR